MYSVNVDKVRKIIKMEVSGFMKAEEAKSFIAETESAMKQFKSKEAVMLVKLEDMKPTSQDVLPILMAGLNDALSTVKKIASVHSSALTQMQMKRVEDEVHGSNKASGGIIRFKSEEDAIKYLLE